MTRSSSARGLCVVALLFTTLAAAFDPVFPEQSFPAAQRPPYDTTQSRVMVGWGGESFLAVWGDDADAGLGAGPGVFGVRLSRDGRLLDTAARPLVPQGTQHGLAFGGGRWLVSSVSSSGTALADLFDASLWRVGPRIDLTPAAAAGEQFTYAGYSAPLNEFAVAWRDSSATSVVRVDLSGGVSAPLVVGPDSLSGRPLAEALGHFLIARTRPSGNGGEPVLNLYSADGGVGFDFPVPFHGRDATSIALATGQDVALVVVSEQDDAGTGLEVWAQGVGVDGGLLGVDGGTRLGRHTVSRLSVWAAPVDGQRFFVTWFDDAVTSGNLVAAYLDRTGVPLGAPRSVLAADTPGLAEPSTACAPDGTCLVGFAAASRAQGTLFFPDGGVRRQQRLAVRGEQSVGAVAARFDLPVALWLEPTAGASAGPCALVGGVVEDSRVLSPAASCVERPRLVATRAGYVGAWVEGSGNLCVSGVQPWTDAGLQATCAGPGRRRPALAYEHGSDVALAAWVEPGVVMAQWYSGAGAPLGAPFQVGAWNGASGPEVAAGDGRFGVAFHDAAGQLVLRQFLGDGGTSSNAAAPLGLGSDVQLAVVRLAGGFGAVWRERGAASAPLLGNVVRDTGRPQHDGGLLLVPAAGGAPTLARVGAEVALAWEAAQPVSGTPEPELVVGALDDAPGQLQVRDVRTHQGSPAQERRVVLGEALDGRALALYERYDGFSTSLHVVALAPLDAGQPDAGAVDGGGAVADAGPGQGDGGGASDAGDSDGGVADERDLSVGCGCASSPGALGSLLLLSGAWLARRRRR